MWTGALSLYTVWGPRSSSANAISACVTLSQLGPPFPFNLQTLPPILTPHAATENVVPS